MRKRAALMSVILSAAMLVPSNAYLAENKEWDAEGLFGSSIQASGMTANTTVSGSKAPVKEVGGREAWTLTGGNWYYHTMYVNATGAVRANGGKHVLVEVDYYDDSDDGWFCLRYNSRDGSDIMTKKERLTASKKWKTASFIMEAPTFGDDFSGADFGISTETDNDYSHSPIYIGGVRLKVIDEVKPAGIEVSFENDGHIYFSDEEPVAEVKIKNKVAKDYTAKLKFIFQDTEGNIVYEQEDSVDIGSMEAVTKNVPLNIKHYGTYTLFVEGSNEELGYLFSTSTDFSYVRLSEYQSDKFGVCNHFAWNQSERDPAIIYPLMRKAGCGWTRDEIKWEYLEKEKGVYELQPFHERFLDLAEENNLKHLLIFYQGNKLYSESNARVPVSDEEVEAYGRYVYNLTALTKGRVQAFEYWNEFDHYGQQSAGAVYENYAKLAQVTYENMKAANPDALGVGICAAGTGLALIKTSFDMGAYDYMDDVSYHTYSNGKPMEAGVGDHTLSVRELINQYPGGEDMKIWLTEMGWTNGEQSSFAGYYNKIDNAKMLPQEYAIQMESGYVERMFYYDMVDDQPDQGYSEATFGILEHFRANDRKVPMAAKPVYVSMAAMNGLMGTPDFVEKKTFNDDNIYEYQFTRREDGADVAMMWGKDKNSFLALKLADKNAKFYDMFGNELDVISTDDGYALEVTDAPIYVVGDFDSLEQGNATVAIKEANIVAAEPQDSVSLHLFKSIDKPLKVELSIQDDSEIEVDEIVDFEETILEIPMTVKGNSGYSEKVGVKVTDEDGKVYYSGNVVVEYADGVEVSGRTKLYQDTNIHRWQMNLNVNSNFHGEPLKATLKIHEPTAFSKKEYDLGEVKNGENNILFHLPEVPEFTSYWMKATITLSNGYTKDFEMPIDFALAFRTENPPTIDGKLSEGEWIKDGKIVSNREDQVDLLITDPTWKGENDLSAKTYIMWDDDNLYLACEVTDDIFSCDYEGTMIWQGDSWQFGLAYNRENNEGSSSSFTEVGLALTPKGISFVKYSTETGTSMELEVSEAQVTREGNKTTYEIKMPWSEAIPEGAEVKPNMEIGYSMLINDNDTFGRRGWIEFGSGIGRYKKVSEFARIRLVP